MEPILKGMRIILFLIFNLLSLVIEGQVTFIIESLPNTTPNEDTIFITGTFNDWNVNDNDYILHPQLDGKYSITIPLDTSKIEFKFSRGSWLKVETNALNEYIPNREIKVEQGLVYYAKIENWQDLGGVKQFNYMVFLLFAIAFYGSTLLFFAYRMQKRNESFIPAFFLFNLCFILTLIGNVFYDLANLIWQAHIGMMGIVVLFMWGPLFYFYLKSLTGAVLSKNIILHTFPVIFAFTIALLRYFNAEQIDFYAQDFNSILSWGNAVLIFLGILSNVIYHLLLLKFVINKKKSELKELKLSTLVYSLYIVSLAALCFLTLIFILFIFEIDLWRVISFEMVLIILSLIIFVEFYYYWKYPELFQYMRATDSADLRQGIWRKGDQKSFFSGKDKLVKHVSPGLPQEIVSDLKRKVLIQMLENKVFNNPGLNIAMLSEMIETKPHILSKLLNEEFNKSFRDFINEYRINEFIKLASAEKYKNYTLLALSYEVGFNSKSTFNLAFKKEMGISPSNYLKNNKIKLRN